MKQITALFLGLWLLSALPVSARAEDLPPIARAVEESLAAELIPEETRDAAAEKPPLPPPEPDALDALLGQNPIDYEVDLAAYYLGEMTAAAAAGDVKAGRTAEASRAAALDAGGKGEPIAFDDLYLLARIIDSSAGSDWLTDEFRMCVGEVVLNRVAHPSFPDSVSGVIYQKGAFRCVNDSNWSVSPNATSQKAARDAINGWDPSGGAIYYYNPRTAKSQWIRTRPVICTIGNHVFCS